LSAKLINKANFKKMASLINLDSAFKYSTIVYFFKESIKKSFIKK